MPSLEAAAKSALESIEIMRSIFPKDSIPRDCFEGAFMNVDKQLKEALAEKKKKNAKI
jgi:hypothetical protein